MKRHHMFRLLALTLVFTMVLGLVSCGNQPQQQSQTDTGTETSGQAEGVNLNYGISNSWDSLMPYYSVSGSNYSRIIYDKLYDRLAYIQPDGTCSPRAATSWESADGGYAILFHLDEGAAFHDGTPVTAQHWVDTIALVTNPACNVLGRDTFAGLTGTDEIGAAIEGENLGAEAVDEYTLKLTFDNPVVPEEFLVEYNRDIYVLPTHLLTDIAPEDLVTSDFWQNPVGSGPCQFVSEVSGSTLVLSANKDYQLGAPGFDTLTITVMDKANLLTALIAGDLDYYTFGGSISEENRPVAEQAGFAVEEGTVPSTFYELMINNETVDSADLRHAIEKALDKELLCQQNTGSLGTVTNTSILPGTEYSRPAGESAYDPEGAKELLAQAGYDGETFTLACTSQRASLAALIQQNLADVGIQVEIETVDSATMFAGMSDGTYDLAVASHTPTSLPLWFTGSRFTADNNLFRVPDLSQYTTLLTALEEETNETARIDLVDEWEALLNQEMPFIPLWFSYALHVQSKTVTGIDYAAAACCNENVWQWEMTQA
ncbi:ABC transporter substrate-binding protein [Evtepia sp.]|uniref:ABC transporter substrate-binding protein n=1 Tax=Evtepia sp. TaxID=2773933 RepID=UPI002E799EFD|nr:ABC transporter substrate-binding protein [Evtepia sp.]MEE0748531.1 ABC transporter substrate-binding protein [Evtepia sp.]